MSSSTTQIPTAGQPIPSPADFSVVWDDPRDAKVTWMLNDRVKTPMPPLTYVLLNAFTVGGNPGYKQAGLPFYMRTARINTYEYLGAIITAAPPDAVMKAMGMLSRAAPGVFKMMMSKMAAGMSKHQVDAVDPILERFETYWQDELLPEIKQHIAYFESCNLRGLSLHQLRAHLAETLKRVERMGALHMLAVLPSLYAMSQFEELYGELIEGATTLDGLRLVQGFDNKTLDADRGLWQLSRVARASPEVRAIFSRQAAGEIIPELERSDAARHFLSELRAWFNLYGQRLNSAFALDEPSWIEEPTIAIECLRAYITQDRLLSEQSALAAEREKAVAEARAKLGGYPKPVIERFETLLKAAQIAAVIHEDHNFWIDQRLFYHVRQVSMEFGHRLAEAGELEAVTDVFYLTPAELQKGGGIPLDRLVKERKAEMDNFSRIKPPPMLGMMPPFDMDDGGPVLRAFFKGDFKPQGTGNSLTQTVKGLAGSAGVARGRAKVIRSLAEAGKLQQGDVLVAEFTVPPWTPLFATAAAVVTDNGGVLSHSAVVAREYRIPAVVGTGNATTTFKDGQLIEVDGNAGTVRVVVEEQLHEPALAG